MAITFDDVGNGNQGLSASSLTVAGIVPNNGDCVTGIVAWSTNSGVTTMAAAFDGNAMTQVGSSFFVGNSGGFACYMAGFKIEGVSGDGVTSKSIVFTPAAAVVGIKGNGQALSGVGSVGTTLYHASGSSTAATVTVTSATGNMAVGAITNFSSATAIPSFTEGGVAASDWNTSTTWGMAMGHAAGATSVVFAGTLGAAGLWGAVGFDLVASAGSNVTVTPGGASSTATGGTPVVGRGGTITPTGASTTATGGSPAVTGPTVVTPGGASTSATPGTPVVGQSDPVVTPGSPTITTTPGTPVVGQGGAVVAPDGASTAATPGTPVVGRGGTDTPAGASTTATGGTPVVSYPNVEQPAGAAATATGGTPVVGRSVPISHDATGVGVVGVYGAGTAFSWNQTVNAVGDNVYADFFVDRTAVLSNVTCDGHPMTRVDTVTLGAGNAGNAFMVRYKYEGGFSTTGVKVVSATTSVAAWIVASSVSVAGVLSLGNLQSSNGTGHSASASVTCNAGDMILQSFGGFVSGGGQAALTASGGTNRFDGVSWNGSVGGFLTLAINEATAPTTFTASDPNNKMAYWGSMAHALQQTATAPVSPIITPGGASITAIPGRPGVGGQGVSPLDPLVTKLAAGQSVIIQIIGDSTAWGWADSLWSTEFGWGGRLAQELGVQYDANVQVRALNYPYFTLYYAPTTIHTSSRGSSGPTILVYVGGWPNGTFANYLAAETLMLPVANPDVVFIQDGFNETSTATYTANYLQYITDVQTKCPGAPIVCTTANITGVTKESGHSVTFAQIFAAMITMLLPGQSLPLASALQLSTAVTGPGGVWVLDTQQAPLTTADLASADLIHPVATGYQKQADWMLSTLVQGFTPPATPTTVTPGGARVTATGGAPTVSTKVINPGTVTPGGAAVHATGNTPTVQVGSPGTAQPVTVVGSRNLRPFQYQISDIVIGAHTQYVVLGTAIASYNVNQQDSQIPLSDRITMGQDSFQAQSVTLTIGVKDNAPMPYIAGHLPADLVTKSSKLLGALQDAWKANDVKQQWGQYVPLIYCDGYGLVKRIYGRPRKFQYSPKTPTSQFRKVTAEFARMDTYCYADTESAAVLTQDANPVFFSVGGDANTWFRVVLVGPQSNPIITVGSVVIQLDLSIVAGVVVEVSGYPWSQRIVDSNGNSWRNKLVGATKYLDQLAMPKNVSIPMSWSAAATSGNSSCTVLWRDAYNVI